MPKWKGSSSASEREMLRKPGAWEYARNTGQNPDKWSTDQWSDYYHQKRVRLGETPTPYPYPDPRRK